jgi:hypothetical protein
MKREDLQPYIDVANEIWKNKDVTFSPPVQDNDLDWNMVWIHNHHIFRFMLNTYAEDPCPGWAFLAKEGDGKPLVASFYGPLTGVDNLKEILAWLEQFPNMPPGFKEGKDA